MIDDNRNHQLDNYKCLLILLVVLGHFLSQIIHHTTSSLLYSAYVWIYLFHMPAFLFVSGFFSVNYIKKGTDFRKPIGFIILFVAFKISIWLVDSIRYSSVASFSLFYESAAPWYLIVLFWCYLLLPVFSKFKAGFIIPLSIVVSLLVSFENSTAFLAICKMINFMPFFLMGYYYNEATNGKMIKLAPPFRVLIKIVSLIILAGGFLVIRLNNGFIKSIEGIVYGDKSFDDLGVTCLEGLGIKCLYIAIVILFIIASLIIMPESKHFFSYIGSRTLGIYIGHILIRSILMKIDLFSFLPSNEWGLLVSLVCVSAIVVVILSYKPFTTICNKAFKINYGVVQNS